MCKTPKMPAPQAPTRYAAAKAPTQQDAADAGQRMTDRLRAQSTILTGPMGVTMSQDTGKKTLLGA